MQKITRDRDSKYIKSLSTARTLTKKIKSMPDIKVKINEVENHRHSDEEDDDQQEIQGSITKLFGQRIMAKMLEDQKKNDNFGQSYDFRDNKDVNFYWEYVRSKKWMPCVREYATFTRVGQKVYLFGGRSGETMNDINVLNTQTWEWKCVQFDEKKDIVPEKRYGHTAVSYGSKMIMFGGFRRYNPSFYTRDAFGDLFIFEVNSKKKQKYQWSQPHVTGAHIQRRHHTATVAGDHMVVYGGFNEKGQLATDIHAFNIQTYKWFESFVEGKSPGKLSHMESVTVLHPEHKKRGYGLFEWVDKPQKNFYPQIHIEGIYYFGGRDENGQSVNTIKVLKIGKKPLKWVTPKTNGRGPIGRYGHSLHYYPGLNCLVVFGGRNDVVKYEEVKSGEMPKQIKKK